MDASLPITVESLQLHNRLLSKHPLSRETNLSGEHLADPASIEQSAEDYRNLNASLQYLVPQKTQELMLPQLTAETALLLLPLLDWEGPMLPLALLMAARTSASRPGCTLRTRSRSLQGVNCSAMVSAPRDLHHIIAQKSACRHARLT